MNGMLNVEFMILTFRRGNFLIANVSAVLTSSQHSLYSIQKDQPIYYGFGKIKKVNGSN